MKTCSSKKMFLCRHLFIYFTLFFALLVFFSCSSRLNHKVDLVEAVSESESEYISENISPLPEEIVQLSQVIIEYETETFPGGLLRVFAVANERIDNLYVVLNRENGENIAKFMGFRYDPGPTNSPSHIECMVAIIGTGSTLRHGVYEALVYINNEASYRKKFSVSVTRREFTRETIPLNQRLTEIRTDDSERRKRESYELYRILSTFNENNVFTGATVAKPIDVEPYYITSKFGDIRTFVYVDGETANSIHHGIDYAAITGSHIYACADGRVIFTGDRIITGYTVVIEHLPGLYSLYYHLDAIYVPEGKFVSEGEKIGTLGSTGLSTGPHLHWEIRNQRFTVDPDYLMATPMIDKDRIISIIKNNFTEIAEGG